MDRKSSYGDNRYETHGALENNNHPSYQSVQSSSEAPFTKDPQYDKKKRKTAIAMGILIPSLYFAAVIPSDIIGNQYLVHRLAMDQGLNVTHHRISICGNDTDPNVKNADKLEAQASDLTLYYTFAAIGPALIYTIFLGGFADMFGRRPFIILAMLGCSVRMVLQMLIVAFNLPLWINYIASAADGCSGGFWGLLLALFSSMADVNPDTESRVFWLTASTSAFSITSAAVSVSTGYLVDAYGFTTPNVVCAVAVCLGFLLSLCVYPETCPMKTKKEYNPFTNIKRISSFFVSRGTTRRKVMLVLCLGIFALSVMSLLSMNKLDALYQMAEPFCWSAFDIGIYNGARQAGQYFFSVILLKLFQKCLRVEWICLLAIMASAASLFLEAFVADGWQFALVPITGLLGAATVPIVRGLISALAGPNDQAAMLSIIAILEVICSVTSATVFLKVYSATVAVMPGAVYIVMAGCSFAAAILLLVYQYVKEEINPETEYKTMANAHGEDTS